ncbi:MAG: hypothetical protein AAF467_10235 [Actinomycetota bacterium]
MRTITITTELEAPPEAVWGAALTPQMFIHITRGVIRYPAAEAHPGPWAAGDRIKGWMFVLGVVPASIHELAIDSIDHGSRTLITEEHGGILRRWRHRITVETLDDGRSHYCDEIEFEAGALDPVVAVVARAFYRLRQRRWHRFAPVLRASVGEASAQSEAPSLAPVPVGV